MIAPGGGRGSGPRSSCGANMPASGQLEFFANDVPGFYWNNFGSIQLEITRLS